MCIARECVHDSEDGRGDAWDDPDRLFWVPRYEVCRNDPTLYFFSLAFRLPVVVYRQEKCISCRQTTYSATHIVIRMTALGDYTIFYIPIRTRDYSVGVHCMCVTAGARA